MIGGRNAKTLREFLEKNYEDNMTEEKAIKLSVQALLEVVDSGAKNMEITVLRKGAVRQVMPEKDIDVIVKQIEAELEESKASAMSTSA